MPTNYQTKKLINPPSGTDQNNFEIPNSGEGWYRIRFDENASSPVPLLVISYPNALPLEITKKNSEIRIRLTTEIIRVSIVHDGVASFGYYYEGP